jgi:hypothetical protein
MTDEARSGGWVIEILGSGSAERKRYVVGIADRTLAISAILVELGNEAHIMSVTRVPQTVLEVAKVTPGKIIAI